MSVPPLITRDMLAPIIGDPRLIQAFEQQSIQVAETNEQATATQQASETMRSAPVVTWGASSTFDNERTLTAGPGISLSVEAGTITVTVDKVPRTEGAGSVRFIITGDTVLLLPETGVLMTEATADGRYPAGPMLVEYASDAAAVSAGVPIRGFYLVDGFVKQRLS